MGTSIEILKVDGGSLELDISSRFDGKTSIDLSMVNKWITGSQPCFSVNTEINNLSPKMVAEIAQNLIQTLKNHSAGLKAFPPQEVREVNKVLNKIKKMLENV